MMGSTKRGGRGAAVLAGVAATLLAVSPAVGGEQRSVLVELFTSQGCSSCPPADEYLSDLATRPGVVALAFHVDYWDRLGWRDPYSLHAATDRQRAYASAQAHGSVYTPQMVIDGGPEAVGHDHEQVERIIARERVKPLAIAPVMTASADGWAVELPQSAVAAGTTVELVTFDRRHVTQVARGENAGRLATDSNVVRSVKTIATWHGDAARLAIGRSPDSGERAVVIVRDANGAVIGLAAERDRPA
jgi:hypothetical protein